MRSESAIDYLVGQLRNLENQCVCVATLGCDRVIGYVRHQTKEAVEIEPFARGDYVGNIRVMLDSIESIVAMKPHVAD